MTTPDLEALAELKVRAETLAKEGRNEATTRLEIVDRVLTDVLNWKRDEFHPEEHASGTSSQYLDYHLASGTSPACRLVLEAKRAGAKFDLPDSQRPRIVSLSRVLKNWGSELGAVVEQALKYCKLSGTPTFAVTNGTQWLASVAWSTGVPLADLKVVVFYDLSDVETRLQEFQDILGKDGLKSQRLMNVARGQRTPTYARSLNELVVPYRVEEASSKNYLSTPLRRLMKLCFGDLTAETHADMLEACYVKSSATDRYLTELQPFTSDNTPHSLDASSESKVDRAKDDPVDAIFGDGHHGGVSLVVGPPGAGKSTFFALLRLRMNSQPSARTAVFLHVDLINKSQLQSDNFDHDRLVDSICEDLLNEADACCPELNPFDNRVLRQVFARELDRQRRMRSPVSPGPSSAEEDEVIERHVGNRMGHLKAWLGHVVHTHGPVVVVLDNVDRGTATFEKVIYQLAEDLSTKTDASIAVSMRGSTYEGGQFGFLDVRRPNVFRIEPPSFARVIEERVRYVREKLADDPSLSRRFAKEMRGFPTERVLDFAEILSQSVLGPSESRECITSMAGSNIRSGLELVERFSTSVHTDINTLFRGYQSGSGRRASPVTLDAFLRSVMKGDYWRYSESRSTVVNLLRGARSARGARFASIRVLQFLDWCAQGSTSMATDVSISEIAEATGQIGYDAGLILKTANFLGRRGLLVSLDRLEPPWEAHIRVRISPAGRYYASRIMKSREYLRSVAFDILFYNEHELGEIELVYKRNGPKTWQKEAAATRECLASVLAEEEAELGVFERAGRGPSWVHKIGQEIAEVVEKIR